MNKITDELESKIHNLATKVDLAKLEGKLDAKIGEIKSEIIKWMFIFWVGQVAVTFGFILLFLNK